jgi:hypothetical protein
VLVDPERLDWPNVGRHLLGAQSVGSSKARDLARRLEIDFPHLSEVSSRTLPVTPGTTKLLQELGEKDLIVSAMGDWSAESFLNEYQRRVHDAPPILYCWLESNAVAAHAVAIGAQDACLRCGMTDTGKPLIPVTDWPQGPDMLQEPSCGGHFTPYGPAELSWAHALMSEATIDIICGNMAPSCHRTWVGRRDHLLAAGGRWNEQWIEQMGDPGAGGFTTERVWPASHSCPVCSEGT